MMQNELEQTVAILEYLQLQIELLQKQLESIQNSISDNLMAKKTLEEYSKLENEELLVPIGGGILVYGTVSKQKKVIMNIGSGVSIELDWNTAVSKIEERLKELEKMQKETLEALEIVKARYSQYFSYAEELQRRSEIEKKER